MKTFVAAHPEFANFVGWARTRRGPTATRKTDTTAWTASSFTDASGEQSSVRWSLIPAAQPVAISPDELAKRGPDYPRAGDHGSGGKGATAVDLGVTVANPGDPTADPSKTWPADRRTVEVGTLVVQRIETEADGPCRDINFDPTVLPGGHHDIRRSIPGGPICRLFGVVQPPDG